MANVEDYCKLHYGNEVIESTVFGASTGSNKTDYLHALLVRNDTHTFMLSLVLGHGINGPGSYKIGEDDVSAYFNVLNNKTGRVDKGGELTAGDVQLDLYSSESLSLRGNVSNLSGDDQPPFKRAEFRVNSDW